MEMNNYTLEDITRINEYQRNSMNMILDSIKNSIHKPVQIEEELCGDCGGELSGKLFGDEIYPQCKDCHKVWPQ